MVGNLAIKLSMFTESLGLFDCTGLIGEMPKLQDFPTFSYFFIIAMKLNHFLEHFYDEF